MPARPLQLFHPPVYDDAEISRRARTLNFMVLFSLGSILALSSLLMVTSPVPGVSLGILLLYSLILLMILAILRRGFVWLASFLFALAIWASMTGVAIGLHGGLSSPAIDIYMLAIFAAGLLMDGRMAIGFAGLGITTALGLFLAGQGQLLPAPLVQVTPLRRFLFLLAEFVLAAVLVQVAVRFIRDAWQRTRQHEQELEEKNHELEEIRTSLEEYICQRTDEILQQKQFFQSLVENSPLAIVSLDQDHKIVSCNPAFETLFGYSTVEAIDKELDSLITTPATRAEASAYTEQVLNGGSIHKIAQRCRKDGSLIWVQIHAVPVVVNGRQIGVLALYLDISEQKRAEEYLRYLATHDPLTILPNRALFYDRLKISLENAAEHGHPIAVMFLDLDGFKLINDTFGHSQGDLLIQVVADRLKSNLRKNDIVARLGGDEFAFIFENIDKPEDAASIAKKILSTLSEPIRIDEQVITISASIGISLSSKDGEDADTLLNSADTAMYSVKEMGKSRYRFFSELDSDVLPSSSRLPKCQPEIGS